MKEKVFFKTIFIIIFACFICVSCGNKEKDRQSLMDASISFSPSLAQDLLTGKTYNLILTISNSTTQLEQVTAEFIFGESNNFTYNFEYDFDGQIIVSGGVYFKPSYDDAQTEKIGEGSQTISLLRGQTVNVNIVIDIEGDKPPTAKAGDDDTVTINTLVNLDGSQSSDPDGDGLTYFWYPIDFPSGYEIEWLYYAGDKATFTPTLTGEYKFRLLVYENKNLLKSDSDYITITAIPSTTTAAGVPDTTADVVLGAFSFTSQADYSPANNKNFTDPTDIAVYNNGDTKIIYVSDKKNNRILGFINSTGYLSNYEEADFVIGQSNFTDTGSGDDTYCLNNPMGIAVDGKGNLYVADNGNNRVLIFYTPHLTASDTSSVPGIAGDTVPDIVLGNPDFGVNTDYNHSYNEIGSYIYKITFYDTRLYQPVDVALDGDGALFVADGYYGEFGRVAVYENPLDTSSANKIDKMIGGSELTVTYSSGYIFDPTASSLKNPVSLAVDSSNNLFVFDNKFNRILRFNDPVSTGEEASLVINQSNFTETESTSVSASRFKRYHEKSGNIALDNKDNLYVSVEGENRILFYESPLTNGMSASMVYGQTGYSDTTSGLTQTNLNAPLNIAFDTKTNDLYVADKGNHRVLVFKSESAAAGPTAIDDLQVASYESNNVTLSWSVADSEIPFLYLILVSTSQGTSDNYNLSETQWISIFSNIVTSTGSLNLSNYSLGIIPILVSSTGQKTTESWTISGLSASTTYYFGVISISNSFLSADISNVVSQTMPAPPSAVSMASTLSDTVFFAYNANTLELLYDSKSRPWIAHLKEGSGPWPRLTYYDGSAWVNAFVSDSIVNYSNYNIALSKSDDDTFCYTYVSSEKNCITAVFVTESETKSFNITSSSSIGNHTSLWIGDTCYIFYNYYAEYIIYCVTYHAPTSAISTHSTIYSQLASLQAIQLNSDSIMIVCLHDDAPSIEWLTYNITTGSFSSPSDITLFTGSFSTKHKVIALMKDSDGNLRLIYEDDSKIRDYKFFSTYWGQYSSDLQSNPKHFSTNISIDAAMNSSDQVYFIRSYYYANGSTAIQAQTASYFGSWTSLTEVTENSSFSSYNGYAVSVALDNTGQPGYVYLQYDYYGTGKYYIRYYH